MEPGNCRRSLHFADPANAGRGSGKPGQSPVSAIGRAYSALRAYQYTRCIINIMTTRKRTVMIPPARMKSGTP